MDTSIKLRIMIEFQLPDLAARSALETKIDSFIAGQEAGSYRNNNMREDPKNTTAPFWFRTTMYIVAPDVATVASARAAVLTALETMPTVLGFELTMVETNTSPGGPSEE